MVVERVNVPGTVSNRLISSAPRVRSVHKDDIMRLRHLLDGFLKVQGTSTFAIVNPRYPVRHDKVTHNLHLRGIQYQTTSDSYLTS